MRGSRVGKGTIVALLLMAMCSCGDRPSSASKQSADHTASAPAASRILVTIESVAASRLALYGGSVPTPSLAGLAARGAVYDDAVSVTPLSRPALVTILTGIAPDRSGVRDNIHDALPSTVQVARVQLQVHDWLSRVSHRVCLVRTVPRRETHRPR